MGRGINEQVEPDRISIRASRTSSQGDERILHHAVRTALILTDDQQVRTGPAAEFK